MWVKNDGFIKLYGEYNILNHLNFTKPNLLKVIQINPYHLLTILCLQ